jgi:hypothetical protein
LEANSAVASASRAKRSLHLPIEPRDLNVLSAKARSLGVDLIGLGAVALVLTLKLR